MESLFPGVSSGEKNLMSQRCFQEGWCFPGLFPVNWPTSALSLWTGGQHTRDFVVSSGPPSSAFHSRAVMVQWSPYSSSFEGRRQVTGPQRSEVSRTPFLGRSSISPSLSIICNKLSSLTNCGLHHEELLFHRATWFEIINDYFNFYPSLSQSIQSEKSYSLVFSLL